MKNLFAVIVIQSFDNDVPTYLFDNEDEAISYARQLYKEAYETEERESAHGVDSERSYWNDEINEGTIFWNWEDDYMTFIVTNVTDKRR